MSYSIAGSGRRRRLVPAFCVLVVVLALPAISAAAKLGSRMLYKGMRGPDVTTLQRDLTASGIKTAATGFFSEGTEIHVKDFQREYGLQVDGVVGPLTVGKLESVVKAAARRQTPSTATTSTTSTSGTATSAGSTTTDTGNPTANDPLTASDSGGASDVPPPTDAPVEKATINSQGLAVAPADAPLVIQEIIAAGNKIAFNPYVYGGGHASFNSVGYDCSGSVSYALHGGGLLSSPLDSTEFESYGDPGKGRWITIYTNAGHAYMDVAGLWFDTVALQETGDRWSKTRVSSPAGFDVVHPAGW